MLANISNSLKWNLKSNLAQGLENFLSPIIVWQCYVGELILENLAKGRCYVFAPYGILMYLLQHSQGGLAATELD